MARHSVKNIILSAGLRQLCRGDAVAITDALEKYQDLDPTFPRTREYRFLADLATAVDEEDGAKFADVVEEFDSLTPLVNGLFPLNLVLLVSTSHSSGK
ncbi:unnamed protein product [Coffea canephora]|uniref:Uncharacterized protein n=1 Tax=Coffea canephora TaxID=49390 RepID=A0A068UFK4_COFCA|nr:unnamed protein product [Coffea canephora]